MVEHSYFIVILIQKLAKIVRDKQRGESVELHSHSGLLWDLLGIDWPSLSLYARR